MFMMYKLVVLSLLGLASHYESHVLKGVDIKLTTEYKININYWFN